MAVTPAPTRASLSCKTSRFAWLATSTGAAPDPAAHDAHDDHGHATELVLPLVRGRSRCPSRGQLLVRVTTPPAPSPRTVELRALGQAVSATIAAGADVLVPASIALAGATPGRHPIEVRIDGALIEVPALDVTP